MFAPVFNNLTYSYAQLLLPMTGANNSTTFTDTSPFSRTITRYGDAKISTTQSKWGNGSGYFDGSGDYLTTPSSANYAMGSSNFTIEMWFFTSQNTVPNATLIARINTGFGTGSWTIQATGDSANGTPTIWCREYSPSTPILASSSSGYNNGQWHHLAWARNGNVHTLYLDGIAKATTTTAVSLLDSEASLSIAEDLVFPRAYAGYLQDIAITKGIARYTADFSPALRDFPENTGRSFLSYFQPSAHLVAQRGL